MFIMQCKFACGYKQKSVCNSSHPSTVVPTTGDDQGATGNEREKRTTHSSAAGRKPVFGTLVAQQLAST